MSLEFKDYSVEVKEKINEAIIAFLYEAGGELEAQVKRNTTVDSGDLKKSWDYKVAEYKGEVTIGSPLQNAIWEEFGTGAYAEKGNGRKTPWYVPVEYISVRSKKPTYQGKVIVVYGKNGQKFYKTDGKRPKRALQQAFNSKKTAIQKALQNKLKGLN